jgi:hypothetical protein
MLHMTLHIHMLHGHVACSCCICMLRVHAAYTCSVFMHVHAYPGNVVAAYPCCLSTLHEHAGCPCCVSMLHAHVARTCYMPTLHKHISRTSAWTRCANMLYEHSEWTCMKMLHEQTRPTGCVIFHSLTFGAHIRTTLPMFKVITFFTSCE